MPNIDLEQWLKGKRQKIKAEKAKLEVHETFDRELRIHGVLTQSSPNTRSNAEHPLLPPGIPNTVVQALQVAFTEPHPATGNDLAQRFAATQEKARREEIE